MNNIKTYILGFKSRGYFDYLIKKIKKQLFFVSLLAQMPVTNEKKQVQL